MIYKRDNILLLLVNLVYLSILMNATLTSFNVQYLYVIFIFILITYLLSGRLNINSIKLLTPHYAYLLIMFFLLFTTIVLFDGGVNALLSFGIYTFPILTWSIFYSSVNKISYSKLFVSSYFLSCLIGYIGIFQFFIEPTLFGFIPLNSNGLIWASGTSFDEYSSFFRATSVLGSPQVFGLFCALNLILALRFKVFISKKLFYFGIVGLGIGGALSWNKAFFLIVLLYITITHYRLLFTNYKVLLFLLGFTYMFLVKYQDIMEILPLVERIFSPEVILEQALSHDGRLDRYLYALQNSNLFIGEGLGIIENQSTGDLQASESYFLQIYYEAGAFTMFVFLFICSLSYIKARFHDSRDSLIIALIIFGMVVVNAFSSPAFFIIWGYLFSVIFLTSPRQQNKNMKYINAK